MNDEILKLAKECDAGNSFDFIGDYPLIEFCEAFYRAAFNAGLEAAAKRLEEMVQLGEASVSEVCVGVETIRALEKRP